MKSHHFFALKKKEKIRFRSRNGITYLFFFLEVVLAIDKEKKNYKYSCLTIHTYKCTSRYRESGCISQIEMEVFFSSPGSVESLATNTLIK